MRDFHHAPALVIWELTRACDLVCRHCRASTIPERDPQELTTEEGLRLLDQIRQFGQVVLVLTGGDPLKRPDLFDLLRYAVGQGLRTTLAPSVTPLLSPEVIRRLKDIGVTRLGISLDGPDALTHDGFRGMPGSFERTLDVLQLAATIGLETQINTTVTRHNFRRLEDIARRLQPYRPRLWSVFFLVPTGRARLQDDLSAEEYEEVFRTLYEISQRVDFQVKTTEAPHYRRYVAQRSQREPRSSAGQWGRSVLRTLGINDGKGFVFISHTGEIYPSGFLPLSAGNVRTDSLVGVYRDSPLFRQLRQPDLLEGKCRRCEYRNICGGSRARAYALTGNYLASDPRCIYEPVAHRHAV